MTSRTDIINDKINRSFTNLPNADQEIFVGWILKYSKEHEYFNGGDVLPAWRESGDPNAPPKGGKARDGWGGAMTRARTIGIFEVVGRSKPSSSDSHTVVLCDYKSNVFVPEFLR